MSEEKIEIVKFESLGNTLIEDALQKAFDNVDLQDTRLKDFANNKIILFALIGILPIPSLVYIALFLAAFIFGNEEVVTIAALATTLSVVWGTICNYKVVTGSSLYDIKEDWELSSNIDGGGTFAFFLACLFSLPFCSLALLIEAAKHMLQSRLETKELADDGRFKTLQTLRDVVQAWDEQVVHVNRLIDRVELGLVQDPQAVKVAIEAMRDEEQYLHAEIEYGRRLMIEGELGTSNIPALKAGEMFERLLGIRDRMETHTRELEEATNRAVARIEVEQALVKAR